MGEVGQFIRGRRFTKADVVEDGIPSIHYGEIYTAYGTAASTTVSHVRRDLAAQLRYAQPGDVVIAGVGETVKDVAKAVAWLGDEPVAIHDDTFLFRSPMNPKFVSYVMQTAAFNAQKTKHVARAKVKRIAAEALAKIRIPVPSIDEQDRIVAILDGFQALEAELEVELQDELDGRRRQYAHYRRQLLTFSEAKGVQWIPIGELIRINFGARITKANHAGTLYPVYGGGGESFRTDAYNRADEWVISRFAMSENCVRRVKGQFWMLDSGFTVDVAIPGAEKDYIGQALLDMQPTIFATSTQSAQKNIDIEGFKRLMIPIPPIEDQQRIVKVLEDFDALLNDLLARLRIEIKARRRQYEYYRDKLLTTDEAAA